MHSEGRLKKLSYIGRLVDPLPIALFAFAWSIFLLVFLLARLVAARRLFFNFDSPKLASKYIHS